MSLIDREYMYPEREKELERIQSLKRIKIAEMNDAVDRGHLVKRKRILNEIIELDRKEDQLITPPSLPEEQPIIENSCYAMRCSNTLPPYLPNSGVIVIPKKKSLLKRVQSFLDRYIHI